MTLCPMIAQSSAPDSLKLRWSGAFAARHRQQTVEDGEPPVCCLLKAFHAAFLVHLADQASRGLKQRNCRRRGSFCGNQSAASSGCDASTACCPLKFIEPYLITSFA